MYLAGNNIVFIDNLTKEQIVINGTEDTNYIVTFDISFCWNFIVVSEHCQLAGILTIYDLTELFDGWIKRWKVMTSSQC